MPISLIIQVMSFSLFPHIDLRQTNEKIIKCFRYISNTSTFHKAPNFTCKNGSIKMKRRRQRRGRSCGKNLRDKIDGNDKQVKSTPSVS